MNYIIVSGCIIVLLICCYLLNKKLEKVSEDLKKLKEFLEKQ